MGGLRDYLIGVISAAMICTVVMRLVRNYDTLGKIAKLMCGIFITYTVLSPLPAFDLSDLSGIASRYTAEAQEAADEGVQISQDALRQSIKERTEAYILDKAKSLEADLRVEVELSKDEIPVPKTVSIFGKTSPYAKKKLSSMIAEEIGVEMENQKWN